LLIHSLPIKKPVAITGFLLKAHIGFSEVNVGPSGMLSATNGFTQLPFLDRHQDNRMSVHSEDYHSTPWLLWMWVW
jgi:hypothetical protein